MPNRRDTHTYTVSFENHLPEDHPEAERLEVSITPTGHEEREQVHNAFTRFLLACLNIKSGTSVVHDDLPDPPNPRDP